MNKITVITVCYNADEKIESTLKSVADQRECVFEYLIIDGKSKDRTLDIVRRYKKIFLSRGISYRIISEKDNGIYDAMNKGAINATGKWLNFMNAGDIFYGPYALKTANDMLEECIDVLYGDSLEVDKNKYRFVKSGTPECLLKKMSFCHQSTFIKRGCLIQYPYDLRYKLCADYNFFLSIFLDGAAFKKVDSVISVFTMDGPSCQSGFEVNEENIEILYEHKLINNKKRLLLQLSNKMKKEVKKHLPLQMFILKKKLQQKKWDEFNRE